MTTFLSGKTFELTPEAKYYEESPLEGTHDRRIKIKVPIKEEGDEEEKKKKAYLSVQQRCGDRRVIATYGRAKAGQTSSGTTRQPG